jgi:phosphoribosylamine--glycine ligase
VRILVIGGGAREHALCHALSRETDVTALHCAPGNAGIAEVAECLDADVNDSETLANLGVDSGLFPEIVKHTQASAKKSALLIELAR